MKSRLDQELVIRKFVATRSQAENYIKLGKVTVDGRVIKKPGFFVSENNLIKLNQEEKYVSRAGLKLASVANNLGVDFKNKTVLDVGSSTGGFTDYALKHGAKKVVAVDVGTDQMHPSLRADPRVELHEKTDVRYLQLSSKPDIILVDVSFIGLRAVLPSISMLSKSSTQIITMVKPQFEAGKADINRGIVKNDSLRRKILKDFEVWVKGSFLVVKKADSQVAGAKGNLERFYHLRIATARRAS
ncbi:TlyA family RNA methyltransferase [Candidatus Saccharibacteria bacterium]|nr:TlyA family RNA methyltransferase [Candidatus Saccharibacteria bacterium]